MSSTSQAHEHPGPTSFWTRYVFSTDHKVIGLQFTFASLLFVILGGLLALGVRYQLAWPMQDVPYAGLLPHNMTQEAPEANVALWPIGGKLRLTAEQTIAGHKLPAGVQAVLRGFPHGIAVTIPAGTRIQEETGTHITLDAPRQGFVDAKVIMGDYDYARQNVLAAVGTSVTIPATENRPVYVLRILGRSLNRPGEPLPELSREPVSLPIRPSDTLVSVRVPPQDLMDSKSQQTQTVELSGEHLLPATALAYTKKALTTDAYLSLFTMHASIMIFFVIIPMLVGGFGNFLIPLMIGARDMAFPKLNMLSYWIAVPVGLLMIISFWVPGGSAGGGWTMYPPLARGGWLQSELGTTLWVLGVAVVGFSSIVGALNYITTIVNMRAPGMSMFRMPLTVWSLFITAILQLFATPVLTAVMILLLFDRVLGTLFFAPMVAEVINGVQVMKPAGGQPLLFQHLFWFYSHPAVYIMILPAMGLTSDIVATYARKPIFGYKPMVFAICAIAGLGFIVWGHHMFQSGMNPVLGTTFMASTIMIAVPSAIKTFNWLGTIWGGNIRFTPAMLNALGFVSMFVIGGLSGIFMASTPVDIQIHDTYFIVAHIHYVLFGGSIFGIFAGLYHWFPKMFGRQLNQKWGVIHFILTFIAFNGTFFLMHILGQGGHPRRYASIMEYPSLMHLQPLNVIMTLFALSLGMAQIPFFYNLFLSLPRKAGRGIAMVFAAVLALTTASGVAYWSHVPGGFNPAATWLGYAAVVLGTVVLAILLWRGLPTGGRIATAVLALSFLGLESAIIIGQVQGKTGPMGHTAGNVLIAAGHGILAAVLAGLLVFAVWALGGWLRLPVILNRLMYLIFLPAFLMPFVIKPDMYIMLGQPQGHAHRGLILILLAVPGLIYLILRRPRDEFGYAVDVNPWHANSLEWQTSSPPPHINFERIPTVYRGPYEYSSPVVDEDYLPQNQPLPPGVVEPAGH